MVMLIESQIVITKTTLSKFTKHLKIEWRRVCI